MDNYKTIELIKIKQNNNIFYIAKFNIGDIKNIFTISQAEYKISNFRKFRDLDENNCYIEKLKRLENKMQGYQRPGEEMFQNKNKVDSIVDYLENQEEFNIIPNSIILSLHATWIEKEQDIDEVDEFSIYFIDNDETCALLFPEKLIIQNNLKPIFVVDGNHRLLGIKKYVEENNIENFEIIVSIIINKDPIDEAQIFKTVNYTVKPVNKSYYYQIIGEFSIGEPDFIYLHYVARLFNETEESPIFGRIKMLGKSDGQTRIKQTISQAFFVEQLYTWLLMFRIKLILKADSNEKLLRIPVLRFFLDKKKENLSTLILIKYFMAIKNEFERKYEGKQWTADDNPILKSIILGGFIELFAPIYIMFIKDKGGINNQEEISITSKEFQNYLSPLFEKDYNLLTIINEQYSKGSSQAILNKFANEILFNKIQNSTNFALYKDALKEYVEWYNIYVQRFTDEDTVD